MQTIRVVLVDDHRLFRDGLKKLLELEPDVEVIGEAKDGEEAVRVVADKKPDVVLLDINMPKGDGVQVIRQVKNDSLPVRFLVITAYDDEPFFALVSWRADIWRSGYKGICPSGRWQRALRIEVAGRLLISFHETTTSRCAISTSRRPLAFSGLKNEEIARKMVVSGNRKDHVSILRKLGLRDRTQAAIMAWRLGLVQRGQQKDGRA